MTKLEWFVNDRSYFNTKYYWMQLMKNNQCKIIGDITINKENDYIKNPEYQPIIDCKLEGFINSPNLMESNYEGYYLNNNVQLGIDIKDDNDGKGAYLQASGKWDTPSGDGNVYIETTDKGILLPQQLPNKCYLNESCCSTHPGLLFIASNQYNTDVLGFPDFSVCTPGARIIG